MSARPVRVLVAVVLAVAATWFVTRPAFGRPASGTHGGGVVWFAPISDGPSDLAADREGVVVTSNAGSVSLLDRHGHLRWRVPIDDVGLGQPALGTDSVLVGAAASVTALDRSDGSTRWTRTGTAAASSLAIAGSTALVGDDSGTLTAIDTASGVPRWSVRYPGALWSGARVDLARGAAVVSWHQSDSPAVRVFDLGTGALRWEAPTDRFSGAPALHDGRVVLTIGDGDRHARVEARALDTGAVQWQTPVPASFEEAIEPALDDDAVAVVDHFGAVTVLDAGTGRIRWQHDLADVLVAARVVLTDHRVALTSYAGVLHVLDRRDGHAVARLGPGRLGGLSVATAWLPTGRAGRGGRAARRPQAARLGRPAPAPGMTVPGRLLAGEALGGRPLHSSPTRAVGSDRLHGITHARIPRSSGATRPPAGGGSTEEQHRTEPGDRTRSTAPGDLHERKDVPWQKERPSSP